MRYLVLFFFVFCVGCATTKAQITYKTRDFDASLQFQKNF